MAQAPRSAAHTASLSDDPIENATTWLREHRRPALYVLGAVTVAVSAVSLFRTTNANTREKASAALYQAQAPLSEGKLPDAQAALQKVATRWPSTAAGQQAAMLLAQVHYEQKQYDAGIKALETAIGSASPDFSASIEGLMGTGYDAKGDFAKAAEHYAKASALAKFALDKGQYRASQARSLMSGNKLDEAKRIWQDLLLDDGASVSQEAKVRLGEIAGLAK